MKKPFKILIIAVMAITMLATGMLSSGNLTKAQQTTSGVVTIAFDDGWNSQFNNSFPLMQEHEFNGTYYIITSFIGAGDYMNMSDLHALQDAGNEIASHSVDHPDFVGLTDAQINYECNASQQLLQTNGFPAINFAYPYGASNSHVDSIVLQYYRSARYSYGAGYLMPIPPTAIQMSIPMGFAGETGDSSALAQDEAVVEQAHATNSWVIIFFHNILTTPLTNPWEIEQSDFAAFLNYVANSGVQVLTVNQALNLWSSAHKVTVLPSSATMDAGQSKTFSATPSGGSGSYPTYQWYVDGAAQSGKTRSRFSFVPGSSGSYLITVTVTDSLGAISDPSSTASVTVSASPTVSIAPAGPVTLDVGQVQAFTATPSGGSGSLSYQWYLDGGVVGSNSASYSYTAAGASHSVTCTVTDSASTPVTSPDSSAVSVTVNPALVAPIVTPALGTVDQGQTSSLTSSSVTTGTSPYTYQWFERAPSGSYVTVGSNSASFSFVTSGATATGSWSFILQVKDNAGAAVNSSAVSVTVNPTISASAGAGGSISPNGSVSVNYGDSQTFTITANTGYHIVDVTVNGSSVGAVSSYTFNNVQAAYTISATFAPTPTSSPSPTATPTPAPTPTATTVPATTDSGATVELAISGNVTSSQISNVTIATNQSATSTTVSFTVTGESGTTGFSNMTIPKSAVPYGTAPTIYIDGQPAQDQGYTQDANDYYVWYTTHFSTHEVSIVFTTTSPSPSPTAQPSLPMEAIYGVAAAVVIVAIVGAVLVLRKSKKRKS